MSKRPFCSRDISEAALTSYNCQLHSGAPTLNVPIVVQVPGLSCAGAWHCARHVGRFASSVGSEARISLNRKYASSTAHLLLLKYSVHWLRSDPMAGASKREGSGGGSDGPQSCVQREYYTAVLTP